MSNSRRNFLHSAILASLTGAASSAQEQTPARDPRQARTAPVPEKVTAFKSVAELQVAKMTFFNAEISRLVLGTNPFYGFSHYNNAYSVMMRDYYTPDKVSDVMHQANRF